MSLIRTELHAVWKALRASQNHRDEALTELRIRNLRGIWDLRIPLGYPVTVLAGPNASGKSTILFACACAYSDPRLGARALSPARLFPNFATRKENIASDRVQQSEIEYLYLHKGNRVSMSWRRRKSWTRRFAAKNGASQPQRQVYLRTLANLTNPSEVRSVLKLGGKQFNAEELHPEFLVFAQRILPWRYRSLTVISSGASDLLFAEIESLGNTRYSEFHMSSGERSILRISKDIAQLNNGLVLIDEIDTGLHPYTQQQAMLELQRIALRKKLQIIVASHSPVVLDSVPDDARIFLDRDDATGQIRFAPLYRDIFQKALYGQSRDQLSVLCEDAVAEGVIRGVFDVLNAELGLRHEDILVGRNTGKSEFPAHVCTLAKFKKLSGFLLILDGDSQGEEDKLKTIAENQGQALHLAFLPGQGSPEEWLWQVLRKRLEECATQLGIARDDLGQLMRGIEQLIEGQVQQKDFFKTVASILSDRLGWALPTVARVVAKVAAESRMIPNFVARLKEHIELWRRM